MTISLRDVVQTTQGTPSTHTAIAGIANGDLYLEFAHNTGGGTVPVLDTTSAFTSIATGADGGGRNFAYGYRVRTGTEGTLATTSGSTVLADIFFAVTGVDSTPVESIVSANGAFSATQTVSASTPTTDNCWHVVVFANTTNANSIITPPNEYTLLGSRLVAGQGNIYAYYKDLGAGSSGVSTGTVSAVYSGSAGGRNTGFIVRNSTGGGGATVTTITGTTATEASAVVFTTTMSGTGGGTYAYSWAGTATAADYTQTLTNGMFTTTGGTGSVTVSGSNITVPSGVTAFTVTVPTTSDTLDEADETIRLVIGGVTASSGTITDDDPLPDITGTSSVSVTAGGSIVVTVNLSAASGRAITGPWNITDGTKTRVTDFSYPITSGMCSNGVTISGSNITIPAGVSSFTITIPTV